MGDAVLCGGGGEAVAPPSESSLLPECLTWCFIVKCSPAVLLRAAATKALRAASATRGQQSVGRM